MAETKICGLNDPAGVAAALHGQARYLGFVFFAKSPRNVSPERAAALAAPAADRADTVAVTVDADDETLAIIAATLKPDWIQLHGREDPARAVAVRRFARKGVIKAIGVARADDLAAAGRFTSAAEALMFDAKAPEGASLPGGNGAAFDWQMLLGRRFERPWFLSGGLTPENVAEAVAASGAGAVDVSSGVESAPGVKDAERIARFLTAARSSR